jgi:uncharacterized protein (TIRG00374 family)
VKPALMQVARKPTLQNLFLKDVVSGSQNVTNLSVAWFSSLKADWRLRQKRAIIDESMNIRSIKFWINAVTIIAMVFLFIFAREQILEAFKQFSNLNLLWLLLIIPVQIFNHFSTAKFYQSYLKTLGEKVRVKELFKVSLEMNFVNNVFPSGGVSGFGYLGVRLKKLGVRGSKSTLMQTSRHFLTFLSFIVYLMIALVLLSVFGSASRFIILIATMMSTSIIFATAILIFIISDEGRVKSFTAALPKLLNSIISFFHRKKKRAINVEKIEALFGDLHKDYVKVKKDWRNLKTPFLWTMTMNFTEILTIFIVYLSFSEIVNPGAIIISYAVANVAGLVAVLPGGVGIYEGLMTAVMASAGVNRGLALSATVVYRVFNMGLFLPIGYIFYQRALRDDNVAADSIPGIGDKDDD